MSGLVEVSWRLRRAVETNKIVPVIRKQEYTYIKAVKGELENGDAVHDGQASKGSYKGLPPERPKATSGVYCRV